MINRSFTPFPNLTTKRLTLRALVADDDQTIFTLRSDSEVNKYLDRQRSNTIDDARGFIKIVNENIEKKESLYWGITLSDSDTLIGTICIYGFSNENDTCEIGYELMPGFTGRGLMNEAVEKVIDYTFDTIKIKKIEAFLHRDNRRSIKLLEKFAFRNSGEPGNINPDLLCYHLTNSTNNLT